MNRNGTENMLNTQYKRLCEEYISYRDYDIHGDDCNGDYCNQCPYLDTDSCIGYYKENRKLKDILIIK